MEIWNPTIWNLTIWNPETFEIQTFWRLGFQMVRFSNGRAVAVPTIQKLDHLKLGHFSRTSNGFWQNGGYLSGFQMIGLLNFRSHLKFRPFLTLPLLEHSKYRLIWISDPHGLWIFGHFLVLLSNILITWLGRPFGNRTFLTIK